MVSAGIDVDLCAHTCRVGCFAERSCIGCCRLAVVRTDNQQGRARKLPWLCRIIDRLSVPQHGCMHGWIAQRSRERVFGSHAEAHYCEWPTAGSEWTRSGGGVSRGSLGYETSPRSLTVIASTNALMRGAARDSDLYTAHTDVIGVVQSASTRFKRRASIS
jgi:hypothetical protein